MQENTGRSKKDVQAILFRCGSPMSEASLRVLNDAFRPFSDPVNSSSGGVLSLTRCFFQEAVKKRYSLTKTTLSSDLKLQEYRTSADAQVCALYQKLPPIDARHDLSHAFLALIVERLLVVIVCLDLFLEDAALLESFVCVLVCAYTCACAYLGAFVSMTWMHLGPEVAG